jgi:hypothetical protein
MMSMLAGEEVSVVVAEHTYKAVTDEHVKSRINMIRRLDLKLLDLLSHPAGKLSDISLEEYEHSPDFVVNQEGFTKVAERVLKSHSPEQAFDAACLLLGVRAGLMVPKSGSEAAINFDDCFEPDNFRQSDHYQSFLAAEKLDSEF